MGFLDWFRRRPKMALRVYLDEPSRLRAIVHTVEEHLDNRRGVLVVAHFAEELITVGQQLAGRGIAFDTRTAWRDDDAQRLGREPIVLAVLARSLPAMAGAEEASRGRGAPEAAVIACEVHPLTARNEHVSRFAAAMPMPVEARAFVSFDHPILRTFAAPWVKDMVKALGLKEGDAIDSPMVTRGLERALVKLGRRCTGDRDADSVGQWLERNDSAQPGGG